MYEVVNDSLEGSYSSSLSVRVGCGVKYGFVEGQYYIEIEGSYHKITKGYNSHDGIYNLQYIVKGFIEIAELSYDVKLPTIEKWFLQRIDIAKCYDVDSQKNVIEYINSLGFCKYPRRKAKFFANESLYFSGTTTTLKVYNKMLEFKKHDEKKFRDTKFNLENYYNRIEGYIRFEVEIKKKVLQKIFGDKKHISVINLEYKDFEKVWSDEVMKMLKIIESDLEMVRGKNEVKERLFIIYKKSKATRLFNFYSAIQLNGIDFVKESMNYTTFWRCIKDLKEARVDFSQMYEMHEVKTFYFNPFEWEEVV